MATWPAGPCGPVGGTQPASSSKGILAEKLQKEEGGAGAGRRVQLFHSNHCPPPTTLTESKQGFCLALKTQDLAAFSSLGGVLFTAKVL